MMVTFAVLRISQALALLADGLDMRALTFHLANHDPSLTSPPPSVTLAGADPDTTTMKTPTPAERKEAKKRAKLTQLIAEAGDNPNHPLRNATYSSIRGRVGARCHERRGVSTGRFTYASSADADV